MQYLQGGLMIGAAVFFCVFAFYAFYYIRTHGAIDLAFIAILLFVWSVASFFEMYSRSIEAKLFFRNIQQLGVFFLPLAFLSFSASFCGRLKLYKFLRLLVAVPAVAIFLIFTDATHHIMRKSAVLVPHGQMGELLLIEPTGTGRFFIALALGTLCAAIGLILFHYRGFSNRKKRQSAFIFLAALMGVALSLVNTYLFRKTGFYIDLTIQCLPSAVTLFYSVFRYRFFKISPVARDKVFEVINQGIFVLDRKNVIVDANSQALEITRGLSGTRGRPVGQSIFDFYKPGAKFFDSLNEKDSEQQGEISLTVDGAEKHFASYYYPLLSPLKTKIGSVLILIDISDRKKNELRLIREAERDPLTGLLNRRGLHDAYMRARDTDFLPACVMMLDMDDFKKLNDSCGHALGDRVLADFSGVLTSALRSRDLIARLGGDEFALVLPKTGKEQAQNIAWRISEKMRENSGILCDAASGLAVSASIGIYEIRDPGADLDFALRMADEAMYEEKRKKCLSLQ